MRRRFAYTGAFALIAAGMAALLLPPVLHAQGISLLADFEYFYTEENTTEKDTGIVTDSELSRFSQLYQLDIGRFIFPNLFINLGGYFEQDDSDTTVNTTLLPELSSDTKEKTIRPYAEVNLNNLLYKAGLAYRKRDTETSGSLRPDETVTVDEYSAVFNWRPVDLPLLNLNYQRIELQDEPLTFDATRDTLNLLSKYTFRDFYFHYTYNRLDNFNNVEDSGNLTNNHNGGVRFKRGFDVKDNRFDVQASAKYIYNTVEFTGTNAAASAVDTPTDSPGNIFYILNDASPTNNEPLDLVSVDGSHPLTIVNIGRNGGFNPVSAGLNFTTPTEVDTLYIRLSSDLDTFPNLASPTQISSLTSSLSWQFYSSDDQVELNWTQHPISSVTYSSIDNQFEIRLASTVTARQIKITTTPLTIIAPGEIRYAGLSSFTSIEGGAGVEPENFDQFYNLDLQWTPNTKTVLGYEGYYRNQEARHIDSERSTLTNGLYFHHIFNPMFASHGRVSTSERTRTTQQGEVDEDEQLYSLSLRANYLDTLNQTLTYSGSVRDEQEGSSTRNSLTLRTNADLYKGWSMNLDLGYSFNSLPDDVDQRVKNIRVGTIVEPNRNIYVSLDYSVTWTDETGRPDSMNEFGTFQILWALTDTLNAFFRYTFRQQEGRADITTDLREFNINWAPFPDGTLQFSIGYNESIDFADQEIKTISPTLTWQVARGVFFDLRYNNGTIDSPTESTDLSNIIAKLRIFY